MTKAEYLNKLELLRKWSDSYYNGVALVDDEVFDNVLKEVEEYEKLNNLTSDFTSSVGAPVFRNKMNHKIKMYSMTDYFTKDEVLSFLNNLPSEASLFVNPKFDGVSLSLVYRNGKFITGVTRGDGLIGEAIPDANIVINNIPSILNSNRNIEVRGEVLIGNKDLLRINKENEIKGRPLYSNRRNAVSGLLRHGDREYVKQCNLFFIPYDLGENDIPYIEYYDLYKDLGNLGFNTSYNLPKELSPIVVLNDSLNHNDIFTYYENIINIRNDIDIQLDGIVVRINYLKLCKELGYTSKYPLFMFAYKFPANPQTTRVKDVIYDVGKTGVITPVALLDPVDIDGVIVKQCTLHNYNFIKDLNIKLNSKVSIIRSGDVIPKIIKSENDGTYGKEYDILPPKTCPSCGDKLVFDGTFYKCINPDCQGSITRKLINFVSRSGMNIEGLGDELIDDLVKKNILIDFRSIYKLTKEDLLNGDLVGEIKANNILKSIEKSKTVDLDKFIYSLCIPGVGSSTAKVLADTLQDDWYRAREEDYSKIDGIGNLLSKRISSYIDTNYDQIEDLISMLRINKSNHDGKLSNKRIAITGSLDLPRHQYEDMIKKEGGVLTNTINKDLDYLIVGLNPSSKLDKAKKLNIEILSLDGFKNLIK